MSGCTSKVLLQQNCTVLSKPSLALSLSSLAPLSLSRLSLSLSLSPLPLSPLSLSLLPLSLSLPVSSPRLSTLVLFSLSLSLSSSLSSLGPPSLSLSLFPSSPSCSVMLGYSAVCCVCIMSTFLSLSVSRFCSPMQWSCSEALDLLAASFKEIERRRERETDIILISRNSLSPSVASCSGIASWEAAQRTFESNTPDWETFKMLKWLVKMLFCDLWSVERDKIMHSCLIASYIMLTCILFYSMV